MVPHYLNLRGKKFRQQEEIDASMSSMNIENNVGILSG